MSADIAQLTREYEQAQQRLAEALRALPATAVKDYEFKLAGSGAAVRLSQLFGGKTDLIVIHNMGRSCAYCTLWADGFAGVYKHLADRAAFVLSTPDDPATAAAFASSREWPFPVACIGGTSFAADMGFQNAKGGVQPGASGFHREADGSITRSGRSQQFGPGDPFCAVWPFLDLLKGGANGWEPKYHYTPGGRGPG